ncbi:MAG: hypothetical protein VB949_14160 [Pseudomonadales bacterium]
MKKISTVILLGVVAAMPALGQDFDAVEIRTTDLGGGIYMLQGAGGNLGLSVGADGVFLIDDDYAPLAEKNPQCDCGGQRPTGRFPDQHALAW